jgi:hypothetical protein
MWRGVNPSDQTEGRDHNDIFVIAAAPWTVYVCVGSLISSEVCVPRRREYALMSKLFCFHKPQFISAREREGNSFCRENVFWALLTSASWNQGTHATCLSKHTANTCGYKAEQTILCKKYHFKPAGRENE